MNSAPKHRLGVASATLATLRQVGMVTSFALAMAVSAAALPQQVMMQLFVGTNVALGSSVEQACNRHAQRFHVSLVLCLVAAGISWVRGKEIAVRRPLRRAFRLRKRSNKMLAQVNIGILILRRRGRAIICRSWGAEIVRVVWGQGIYQYR